MTWIENPRLLPTEAGRCGAYSGPPLSMRSALLYDESTIGADGLSEVLRRGFEEALTALVAGLPSHREVVDYALRRGHRTRPVGCLLSCVAVGGDWRQGLDAALAVELIHKSSVIRDDIVDGDESRSGQPALHVAYGTAAAIAVSDLLWSLGLRRISDRDAEGREGGRLRACTDVLFEMSIGQLEDVSPSLDSLSVEARLKVEEQKTGTLSELSCRLGAMSGGGTAAEIAALARFGRNLGTAFQILNSVRNLRGEESGRRPGSDLRNRRETVLSAHVHDQGPSGPDEALDDARAKSGELGDAEVRTARAMLLSAGAAEFGEQLASAKMGEASASLEALMPTAAREILDSLTRDVLLAYAF
jgi:geranylgeranyl diphosphate synthase type I